MDEPRYVDLQYMADKLSLPIETLRTYHKLACRHRRENKPWPSDLPAADAPSDVQATGRPRWLKATADAYVAAKLARRGETTYKTASGGELTDDDVQQLADEAERGYDIDTLTARNSRRPVAPRKLPDGPVMVRLSKAERELAKHALTVAFNNDLPGYTSDQMSLIDALNGPRGWTRAMRPEMANKIAETLTEAWRGGVVGAFELAARFRDEQVPARRTKRGGWAPGVRTGDRTE